MRSRGLVIGSREKEEEEKEEEEKEREEKEEEEEKNLQIAFRCIEAVPILSLDYWYSLGVTQGVSWGGSPSG